MIEYSIKSIYNLPIIFLILYLLGSIPFGLILTNLFGSVDIRKVGSGNIGATNVLRTGNKNLAILTLLLDFSKSFIPILILNNFLENNHNTYSFLDYNFDIKLMIIVFGYFPIIGHCFPIWLSFRGGKGVATTLGVIFAFNYLIGLIIILIWLFVFALCRISSLSALISISSLPVITHLKFLSFDLTVLSICFILLIFYTHRANIKRLIKKNEKKF